MELEVPGSKPCLPESHRNALNVLQSKVMQGPSVCAKNVSPPTSASAVLEAGRRLPRSILEEVLAPLTVGASCVVLTDTPSRNLHCEKKF